MCSESIVGVDVSEWCGTGWTGQPNVIQLPDGSIEVREGAYDGALPLPGWAHRRAGAAELSDP